MSGYSKISFHYVCFCFFFLSFCSLLFVFVFLFGLSSSLMLLLAPIWGADESILSKHADFLGVSMGTQEAWQCQRGFGQHRAAAPLLSVHPAEFQLIFLTLFSFLYITCWQLVCFSSFIHLSSSISPDPPLLSSSLSLALIHPSPFVVVCVWRAAINKDKQGGFCLCVLSRAGRRLSDSIVSLSTSPHSTAQAFFSPTIPPSALTRSQ